MFKPACGLLVAFILAGSASAAAPSTLGYQGRLATAGGQPVTGNLSITFRLYDVASGGSALWTETQGAVAVDGGNLAVELGSVTPLPNSIWGRQLWLGVQVAGDSEMLPRPALTAAPFALRAASTMKNTVHVSAEGTPVENGTALMAAVAAAATATAQDPIAIELDAGTYDLGSAVAQLPPFVTLSGRSQSATTLTSSNSTGVVRVSSNAAVRDFTARATGTPPDANSGVMGIFADGPVHDGTPVQNVRMERVTGISTGATGALGARWGLYACASNSRVTDSTGIAQGGQFTIGFRADCPTASYNLYENVEAISSQASDGVRGVYLAGSGVWRNLKVFVTTSATAQTNFGIRVFQSQIDQNALLTDAIVNVTGSGPAAVDSLIEGMRIESADVDIVRARIDVVNAQAVTNTGIQLKADPGPFPLHVVRIDDSEITVGGIQRASIAYGWIQGIRAQNASPQISRSKVVVRCLAGGYNDCSGVVRSFPLMGATPQAGAMELHHADVTVGHEGPADSSAQSNGFVSFGTAAIVDSTIRVLRSASGENQSGIQGATSNSDIRVSNSRIEIASTATPTADCALAGLGAIELYSSAVQGQSCAGGATLTCAGNTKRGAGFLASTCP